MKIYKEGNKIIVELGYNETIFNDSDSTVLLDANVSNDVNLIVNPETTIISGLNTEEYKELLDAVKKKVFEIRNRHNDVEEVKK